MSLVGPRPLIEDEDRRSCRAGRAAASTSRRASPARGRCSGRTNIPFDEMVKLDYLYVTNWSLWTDLRLILRTVPALLSRRGAN